MTYQHALRLHTSKVMLAMTTLVSSYSKGGSFSIRKISGSFQHQIFKSNCPSRRMKAFTPFLYLHTNRNIHALAPIYLSNRLNLSLDGSTENSPSATRSLNTSSKQTKKLRKYKTNSKEIVKGNKDDENRTKKKFKEKSKIKEKRILRIDRVLSNRGVGSRSEMHELVKKKRVAIKDAKTGELTRIKGPSVRVPKDAAIFVDGVEVKPLPLILAYHKPKGILSAMKDDAMGRKHLGEVLDPRYVKAGLHPVGRLDFDTSGLILFSSNGDLTQRLLHPRHNVEKEYVATVENPVDEDILKHKLENGVKTSEGIHTAKLLDVSERFEVKYDELDHEDREVTQGESIDKKEGDEDNEDSEDVIKLLTNVRLSVSEGKHRMVRRMLANTGHPVVELKRERHGNIELGDMDIGEFRDLSDDENAWVEALL